MVYGISFWMWIGYDTEKKTYLYEMGENALDLLVQMELSDYFEDRDLYLIVQLEKKGMTLTDMMSAVKPGTSWEKAEEKANLKPLTTWEIVDLISDRVLPRYQQVKLLEIVPDEETVFDYSKDRDKTKDDQLESKTDLLLDITILFDHEKLQFKARGPKEASKMLREVFETRHISMLDLPENISLDLRYLHLGEAKKIGLNGAVVFVEALRE